MSADAGDVPVRPAGGGCTSTGTRGLDRPPRQALGLARDTAHRYGETRALIGLAAAQRDAAPAREAVDLARQAGYRALEAKALLVPAEIAGRAGDLDRAEARRRDAVTLLTDVGAADPPFMRTSSS